MAKRDMLWVMGMPWPAALMALLCATLVIGFVGGTARYKPFRIPAGSMQPFVWPGDFAVVDGWAYRRDAPKAGDVVVFYTRHQFESRRPFIKRIVAGPGQTVQIRGGVPFINGQAVKQKREGTRRITDHRYAEEDSVAIDLHQEALPNGANYMVFNRGLTEGDNTREYRVRLDAYFMLGDDRDNSSDSRLEMDGFGIVPKQNIIGKVVLTIPGGHHQVVQ